MSYQHILYAVDGGVAGNFLGRLPGISQITRG